ncbi:MAG: YihY/virulence factor BrkB family protein [Flavobacteriaceae bacterium]|nr:YihY/virulence factor BrkB family protein [Flavobacteriaceae bacterium]
MIPVFIKNTKLFQYIKKGCEGIKPPGFEGLSVYDITKQYVLGIIDGAFSARAGAISYSFFMAIFPFILFILNLIPFIQFEGFQSEFNTLIDNLLPGDASDLIFGVFQDIAAKPRGGLLSTSFFLSIIFAANGVHSIFDGFQQSYHTVSRRNFFKQYVVAIGVAFLLVVLLFVFIGLIIYSEFIYEGIKNFRIFFYIFMIYLFIAVLYKFGTKSKKNVALFSIGALVTTILILINTYLFGIYVENFSKYNELYGSIGAILILMVYIWLNSNLLLLGYELNATLRKLKTTL